MSTTYVFDCSDCIGGETERCDECIVNFLVGRDVGVSLTIDEEELRAIRVLADAGLVPDVCRLRAVS